MAGRRSTSGSAAVLRGGAHSNTELDAVRGGARPLEWGGVEPTNKASSRSTRQLARSRRRRRKEMETSVSAKGFGNPGSATQVQERFGHLNCAQRKRERERNGTH